MSQKSPFYTLLYNTPMNTPMDTSLNTPVKTSNNTPSIITPSSIINSVLNNTDLTYEQKKKVSTSIFTKILIFIIKIAPLISGYGAMCYATGNFVNVDVNNVFTNNTGRILINLFIFICGMITVLEGIFIDILIDLIKGLLV